jgi:hypothetical protein
MTKRSIETDVEGLEDEHGAANEVSLDDALRAMQSNKPAGAYLRPEDDPPPVLFPAADEGFFVVDPFDDRLSADVAREAAGLFRDVHDLSIDEFDELRGEVDRS